MENLRISLMPVIYVVLKSIFSGDSGYKITFEKHSVNDCDVTLNKKKIALRKDYTR